MGRGTIGSRAFLRSQRGNELPEVTPADSAGRVGGIGGGMATRSLEATTETRSVTEFAGQVDEDLHKLSAQEEQILRLLFGIGRRPQTREELGARLGLGRGWLHQLEARALRNLRRVAVLEQDRPSMCGCTADGGTLPFNHLQ